MNTNPGTVYKKVLETLYAFSEDSNIQDVLLNHHGPEYEDGLDKLHMLGTSDAGEVLKTYFELRQAEEQLSKIEARFYTAKANLREVLTATLAVAHKVEDDLNKSLLNLRS